ncbi:MAG: hypothetical protein H6709_24670 [Kofleriaceae bacterium]|nr:hypothetical protein [Kofleriaceae bacterium]MCB9575283.1 hypothetical protein [Kofleriaceae bacterium]
MRRLPRSQLAAATVVVAALALALASGCGGATPPRPTEPWQRVLPPGATHALYLYPEVIERYAPDDAGGYLVHAPAGADGAARAALIASLAPPDPDDVVRDGVVVRLDAAGRDALAGRADVGAVEVLQPADRLGFLWDQDAAVAEVRVDLFVGASDDERDAVAAWLEGRGAVVVWRGPAALRARVPQDAIRDLARLGPVRWVE